MRKRVVVYGWYGHHNVGDEAFKVAFQSILPEVDLTFVDKIPDDINSYDALIIGGGSFLEKPIDWKTFLINIPIAFIGVGFTDNVAAANKYFMDNAKIVVARNNIPQRENWISAPDLVYALPAEPEVKSEKDVVMFLPNANFSPNHSCPEWHSRAWDWYVLEMAKCLDWLAEQGKEINIFPMCMDKNADDRRAAAYIIDRMKYKLKVVHHDSSLMYYDQDMHQIKFAELLARSSLVVSHRLHGMVFAQINKKKFIGVSGHDKMDQFGVTTGATSIIPYYGFSKKMFLSAMHKYCSFEYAEQARKRWNDLSPIIKDALHL